MGKATSVGTSADTGRRGRGSGRDEGAYHTYCMYSMYSQQSKAERDKGIKWLGKLDMDMDMDVDMDMDMHIDNLRLIAGRLAGQAKHELHTVVLANAL